MFNAKTISKFLTKEECNFIINTVKEIDPWETGGDEFWNNRSLNMQTIYDNHNKELGKLLHGIRSRVGIAISKLYGSQAVYSDLFQVVRWFPGMEQPPHADDMTNIDDPELEWFKHRHFGAIIYLNDNYSGGQTYYPQHDQVINPEVGKLAIHPGTPDHMHGVTKIDGNIRYTLASFWTFDKEYADGWSIPE